MSFNYNTETPNNFYSNSYYDQDSKEPPAPPLEKSSDDFYKIKDKWDQAESQLKTIQKIKNIACVIGCALSTISMGLMLGGLITANPVSMVTGALLGAVGLVIYSVLLPIITNIEDEQIKKSQDLKNKLSKVYYKNVERDSLVSAERKFQELNEILDEKKKEREDEKTLCGTGFQKIRLPQSETTTKPKNSVCL